MKTRWIRISGTSLLAVMVLSLPAVAQENAEELAKKLSNPLAALISFPLQNNFDYKIGPEDEGFRWTLNVQPVVPMSLNEEWNVISRTITPVVYQSDIYHGAGSQFGLGDIVQSLFFSIGWDESRFDGRRVALPNHRPWLMCVETPFEQFHDFWKMTTWPGRGAWPT